MASLLINTKYHYDGSMSTSSPKEPHSNESLDIYELYSRSSFAYNSRSFCRKAMVEFEAISFTLRRLTSGMYGGYNFLSFLISKSFQLNYSNQG